jgi:hypothetical protein
MLNTNKEGLPGYGVHSRSPLKMKNPRHLAPCSWEARYSIRGFCSRSARCPSWWPSRSPTPSARYVWSTAALSRSLVCLTRTQLFTMTHALRRLGLLRPLLRSKSLRGRITAVSCSGRLTNCVTARSIPSCPQSPAPFCLLPSTKPSVPPLSGTPPSRA